MRTTIDRRQLFAFAAAMPWAITGTAARQGRGLAYDLDSRDRIVAPVFVDGRGPFRFMLDTGAGISAVSELLATEMRLRPPTGNPLVVSGVLGQRQTPGVELQQLRCDGLQITAARVAVFSATQLGDLDGLLGADLLRTGSLLLDFEQKAFALRAADRAESAGQRLKLRLRFGGLPAVSLRVGDCKTWALIDSGAPHSIGNDSLRDWLDIRAQFEPRLDAMVADVAGGRQPAILAPAPALMLGKRLLPAAPLRFTNLTAFERWGWRDQPALLLGLDRLRQLRSLQIDYRKARLTLPD